MTKCDSPKQAQEQLLTSAYNAGRHVPIENYLEAWTMIGHEFPVLRDVPIVSLHTNGDQIATVRHQVSHAVDLDVENNCLSSSLLITDPTNPFFGWMARAGHEASPYLPPRQFVVERPANFDATPESKALLRYLAQRYSVLSRYAAQVPRNRLTNPELWEQTAAGFYQQMSNLRAQLAGAVPRTIINDTAPVCGDAEGLFVEVLMEGEADILHNMPVHSMVMHPGDSLSVEEFPATLVFKSQPYGEPNAIVINPNSPYHLWIANAKSCRQAGQFVLGRPLDLRSNTARELITVLSGLFPEAVGNNPAPQFHHSDLLLSHDLWTSTAAQVRASLSQQLQQQISQSA